MKRETFRPKQEKEHDVEHDAEQGAEQSEEKQEADRENERIVNLLQEVVSFLKSEFQVDNLTTGEILDLRRITSSVIKENDQYIKAVKEGRASGEHKFPGLYGEVVSRWMSDMGVDIRFKTGYEFYGTGHLRALRVEDKTTGKDYLFYGYLESQKAADAYADELRNQGHKVIIDVAPLSDFLELIKRVREERYKMEPKE